MVALRTRNLTVPTSGSIRGKRPTRWVSSRAGVTGAAISALWTRSRLPYSTSGTYQPDCPIAGNLGDPVRPWPAVGAESQQPDAHR